MSLSDLGDGVLVMCVYEPSQSEVCHASYMVGLWALFSRRYASILTREVSTEIINSILNSIREYIRNGRHFFLDAECFERDAENRAIRKYEMYIGGKCGVEALQDRCLFLVLARCGVALSNQHELQSEVVSQVLKTIRKSRFESLKTTDEFVSWLMGKLNKICS